MKKTLSLLLFVVLAWPLSVFGELTYGERSLQGIDAFRVEVEVEPTNDISIAPEFNSQNYKNAIELRLRSLGVQIDGELDIPVLFVSVQAIQLADLPFYAFGIVAQFTQKAFVLNDEGAVPFETYATTWDASNTGHFGPVDGVISVGVVEKGILQIIDHFANAYFKANPPEPRSGQRDE